MPLPDTTSEAEAARIAQVVLCADCLRSMPSAALQAMQQATAGITKANEGRTSLDTPSHIGSSGDRARTQKP